MKIHFSTILYIYQKFLSRIQIYRGEIHIKKLSRILGIRKGIQSNIFLSILNAQMQIDKKQHGWFPSKDTAEFRHHVIELSPIDINAAMSIKEKKNTYK